MLTRTQHQVQSTLHTVVDGRMDSQQGLVGSNMSGVVLKSERSDHVYGSRYLAALAKECKYRDVSALHVINGGGFILTLGNGIKKRFPTAKSVGLWMEGTINDWYTLGVK
jgi:hypothetical protein